MILYKPFGIQKAEQLTHVDRSYPTCFDISFFQYITQCTLLFYNEKYVDANLDAPDNVISGNEPSSDMLTSHCTHQGFCVYEALAQRVFYHYVV